MKKSYREDREQIHIFPKVHVGHRVLDSDSGLQLLSGPSLNQGGFRLSVDNPSSSFTETKHFLSNRLAPSINDTMQRQKSK